MPQLAGLGRPLGELHLTYQPWLHEAGSARDFASGKRRVIGRKRAKLLGQLIEHPIREPRPDAAGRNQMVAFVVADDQRPDTSAAPAFARNPAGDDALLALVVLDLQPGAGSLARLVTAVEALRHDTLHPCVAADLKHVGTGADRMWWDQPVVALQLQAFQQLAAFGIRQPLERAAIDEQEVEDHVGDGHLAVRRDAAPALVAASLLPRLERRPPVLIEGHDLTVEDHAVISQLLAQALKLWIVARPINAVAATDVHLPVVDAYDGPNAIPLHLERPVGVVLRQRGAELGQ